MLKQKKKETEYKLLMSELVTQIHELRMRKEALIPQYLLRVVSAEAQFYRAAADYAEHMEKNVERHWSSPTNSI